MTAAGTRDGVALLGAVMGLLVVMVCATTAAQPPRPDDLYVPAGNCDAACCHRLWNPSACASNSPGIGCPGHGAAGGDELPSAPRKDSTDQCGCPISALLRKDDG